MNNFKISSKLLEFKKINLTVIAVAGIVLTGCDSGSIANQSTPANINAQAQKVSQTTSLNQIQGSNTSLTSDDFSLNISNEGYQFQQCTLDVTNKNTLDISDYYENFNNPFAFYTNPNYPGVTLPGPSLGASCGWTVGRNFTWNSQNEQCILNGTFGNSSNPPTQCTITDGAVITDNSLITRWTYNNGKTIMITGIPGESGPVPVTIGFGHGVLTSTCGGVALVKNIDAQGNVNYAAVMQVDARAWSFEISQPASTNLASDNYGGTCYIPQVFLLSQADVLNVLSQLPSPGN